MVNVLQLYFYGCGKSLDFYRSSELSRIKRPIYSDELRFDNLLFGGILDAVLYPATLYR